MLKIDDSTSKIGDALQQQAADMVAHMRQRQSEVDHRESELNARVAKIENDNRSLRLQITSQKTELEEKARRIAEQRGLLEERLGRLADAEKSYQQRRQELEHAQQQLEVRSRVVGELERKVTSDQKRYLAEHQLKMEETERMKKELHAEKSDFEEHVRQQLAAMKEYLQKQSDKAKKILADVDVEISQRVKELEAREAAVERQVVEFGTRQREFEAERETHRQEFLAGKNALQEMFQRKIEEYAAELDEKYESRIYEAEQVRQDAEKAAQRAKQISEEKVESAKREADAIQKEAQTQGERFLEDVHRRSEAIFRKAETQAQDFAQEMKGRITESSESAMDQSRKVIQDAHRQAEEIIAAARQQAKALILSERSVRSDRNDRSEEPSRFDGAMRRGFFSGREHDSFSSSSEWDDKERNVQRMLEELQKRQEGLRKRESALADVRNQMEAMAHELMDERRRMKR